MIVGWKELRQFTGYSQCFLDRAIALYGFPDSRKKLRRGKQLFKVWSKERVKTWMSVKDLAVAS